MGRCGVSEDGDEGVTSGEGRQGSAVVVVKDGHEVFMELPELLGEGGVRVSEDGDEGVTSGEGRQGSEGGSGECSRKFTLNRTRVSDKPTRPSFR